MSDVTVLRTGYDLIDFTLDGISGVFRARENDLERVVSMIRQNRSFFEHLCLVGAARVLSEIDTHTNWGNGWEWQENTHPKLEKGFRLSHSLSWFTSVGREKSMKELHNIQPGGFKLLYSSNPNLPPFQVCYFFPKA